MKQVYCLYRVSTVQQLREDDIPMQRQACREFAATHQWGIIKELYEKGISGFKTPIQDRKVLQQIKKDAELRKFDILLVFMFDRLGPGSFSTRSAGHTDTPKPPSRWTVPGMALPPRARPSLFPA